MVLPGPGRGAAALLACCRDWSHVSAVLCGVDTVFAPPEAGFVLPGLGATATPEAPCRRRPAGGAGRARSAGGGGARPTGGPGRCYGRSTAPAARSTATKGVLNDESGDGEETHRELLAWLSVRADSLGQHRPPGLRQASSIDGNYPAGLSRIRRIGNRPILRTPA